MARRPSGYGSGAATVGSRLIWAAIQQLALLHAYSCYTATMTEALQGHCLDGKRVLDDVIIGVFVCSLMRLEEEFGWKRDHPTLKRDWGIIRFPRVNSQYFRDHRQIFDISLALILTLSQDCRLDRYRHRPA